MEKNKIILVLAKQKIIPFVLDSVQDTIHAITT